MQLSLGYYNCLRLYYVFLYICILSVCPQQYSGPHLQNSRTRLSKFSKGITQAHGQMKITLSKHCGQGGTGQQRSNGQWKFKIHFTDLKFGQLVEEPRRNYLQVFFRSFGQEVKVSSGHGQWSYFNLILRFSNFAN